MFWRNLLLIAVTLLVGCSQEKSSCTLPETTDDTICDQSARLTIDRLKDTDGYAVHTSNKDGGEQSFILSTDKETYQSCNNFIQIPIKNAVIFSAPHLYMIDTLGGSSIVSGFSQTYYTAQREIQENMKNGKIKELGDFATADIESIIMLKPDLVMISGFGDNSVKIEQLKDAGIPVIENYEWQESTPLGRTEWIKLFGVLLNKERLANSIFDGIKSNYNEIKNRASMLPEFRDGFLYGAPYKGSWSVPGGRSFIAQIFEDGNIQYPWVKNQETGSLTLDLESITYAQKDNALWLSCGHNTKESLLNAHTNFEDFKAFNSGKIFNYNKKTGYEGVIWYWEESVLRCDKILSDLVEICHFGGKPEQLYFFKEIE